MSEKLKIALIQSSLIWQDPEANRKIFSKKIATIEEDVKMVILPEMFTTGFTMTPDAIAVSEGLKTVNWMQQEALKNNVAIVGSIVFFENGNYYNRLWFIQPDGATSSYNKRHTFTLAGEDKVYKRGENKVFSSYENFNFSSLICYDLRFPVWSRNDTNYDVLIYVANWPKIRIETWDTLLKARAIENMAYCIGVNRVGTDINGYEYNGHSAVYSPMGEQLVFSDKEEILYATLDKNYLIKTREKFKFLGDKDAFSLS